MKTFYFELNSRHRNKGNSFILKIYDNIMENISNIIDDLSIASLENSINLAAVAVISDEGKILFQTENFDLRNNTSFVFEVLQGKEAFIVNNLDFKVDIVNEDAVFCSNTQGMGHIVLTPYQGGAILAFAMPNADLSKIVPFLQPFVKRLNAL
ncbi:MAG: hypothetical protein GF364_02375 [Candidatus Lokiarchaeota archaeon]|nr:hypothetical protein [Candidatus Lokiarchaeota archaeon]